MKICQVCGTEVSDTARFCRKCGAKLEEAAAVEGTTEEASGQSADLPLDDAPESKEFNGEDYRWGPPTGGENYDEPAMPAVFIGDAQEEAEEPEKPYTYRLESPGWDHTDDFDPKDISDNKVTAMAAYLLGPLGVIIALLAGKESPYAAFHMRQGLKFVVVEALLSIICLILCWTLIVPAAGAIAMLIIWIVKVISFVSVCKGRAVEPPIIRSLGFLK